MHCFADVDSNVGFSLRRVFLLTLSYIHMQFRQYPLCKNYPNPSRMHHASSHKTIQTYISHNQDFLMQVNSLECLIPLMTRFLYLIWVEQSLTLELKIYERQCFRINTEESTLIHLRMGAFADLSQLQLRPAMSAQENYHRRFRGYKVDSQLQGVKDASLGYTIEQIQVHCQRVTAKTPQQMGNCINLNCASQKYYIDCFEVLKNRKECIKNLRLEVEQNGQYRVSHLKTD